MALSAQSMANAIIKAMDREKPRTAEAANKTLGDAILKNICDTIEVTYFWAGVGPPPASASDPVTMFQATVSGGGTLRPPGQQNPNPLSETMLNLSTLIKGLTITAPAPFALSPLMFNPLGAIEAAMNNETTMEDAMQNLCTRIVASMQTFINPQPVAGSHATFSGATTGMLIG